MENWPEWGDDWDRKTESGEEIAPRTLKRDAKNLLRAAMKREELKDVFIFPAPGESVHTVSNGKFDYWTYAPLIVERMEKPIDFWCSTWSMNRGIALDIVRLFDKGAFRSINILTGMYFKRREPAVYSVLLDGLKERKQNYRAAKNHAKVILFDDGDTAIVCAGSANLTSNPRIEQTVVTSDRELFEFHRGWMKDVIDARR